MAYNSDKLYLLKPTFTMPNLKEAIDKFYEQWLPLHSFSSGNPLFHYTTLEGLEGILESRALWCSHASTLNDPQEIQYGQAIVLSILDEMIRDDSREEIKMFLRGVRAETQAFGLHLFHSFVACFCKSENVLSQWRGYADRGGGYCLGFKLSNSTQFSSDLDDLDSGLKPYLRQIIYEKDRQVSLVRNFLVTVVEAISTDLRLLPSDPDIPPPVHEASILSVHASNVLMDMMISFKHHAFDVEQEWRLVRVTTERREPDKLRFRKDRNYLVPYRPTHIYEMVDSSGPVFPLCHIGFGPKHDPVWTRSTLRLLLSNMATKPHPIKIDPNIEIKGVDYKLRY